MSTHPEATAKLLTQDLQNMRDAGQKITMITAYSYPQGLIVDQAGVDIILVGDSLGMVELGYPDTVPVTMEEMLMHTKAVTRGVKRAHVVADLPFMSYNISIEQGVTNAGILYQQGRGDSVKFEGGQDFAPLCEAVVKAGIPVFAHIGLTPQTAATMGGFKVQGKSLDAAKKTVDDALALEAAGAFAIILEAIPQQLAQIITETVKIPTIGIGGGPFCSGQVLVFHDLLGLFKRFTPKFVKVYGNFFDQQVEAVGAYLQDVRESRFPGEEHSFNMKAELVEELKKAIGKR
ncbi:MAG: 3-methyl-2-oxobutanoate hydroxymethyltransferase [Spirochaetales bacterium]|jgi:3-methyl-2-oxobutanoate hydroxymethyltransferase|nr:3-methyl-2-oxobutanoate hydroxymethyltransferase [Spirochaetales bacterium]